MAKLFKDFPHLRQAVNWSCFGFPERSGDESTIWIGSAEASTPCHIDTYGCNLVAQIYGTKKWILFPPSETPNLYPTRIPYEESSVFSQVNVTNPDLRKFPAFETVVRYEVIGCLCLCLSYYFTPMSQRYRYCCTSIAEDMGSNPVQAWFFFQSLISQLLKLCVTAVINQKFISFSAVKIYDISHIHLHYYFTVVQF